MYKFIASITATAALSLLGSNLFINDVQACGGYEFWKTLDHVEKKADVDLDEAGDDAEVNTNAEQPVEGDDAGAKLEEEAIAAPKVQLAILLDTSGSMDGLIDQARSQLWKIVNEFATVKQDGVLPDVEVALYEYGNDGLPAEEGFLRLIVPLTTDLDRISEELFALTTNGGSEYCGHVIDSAVKSLQWSESANDYKAVFIAGNEPFTQGEVDYQESCKAAIAKGILVNTIHCGDYQVGVDSKWLHGAKLADGSYMAINSNAAVAHIDSPFDEEIIELGEKINDTYIPWGDEGEAGAERQKAQDSNAANSSGGSSVERAVQKKNHTYRNDAWDLVDAIEAGKVKLEDVKKEDLPEELQELSDEELKEYVEKKKEERAEISEKLNELEKKRNEYVSNKRKEMAEDGEETLDEAMIKAIREQAEKKNFTREGAEEVKEEGKEESKSEE